MTRHDNNYGAGGSNFDEFGELPEKRIESMNGVDISVKRPHLPGNIAGMIWDFYDKTGKRPTKLCYPGPKSPSSYIGNTVPGIGFVGLDLHNMENIKEARLE